MHLLTPPSSISSLSDNLLIYSSGTIPIISKELNLKQTLLGGQAFRWTEQNLNEFMGVLGVYVVRLQYQNDQLRYTFFTNNLESIEQMHENHRRVETALILHNYFQLTIKLTDLFEKWSRSDERFDQGHMPTGIRILAQDPLENLISFICSSNNNVQRISKMIQALCREYGNKIGTLNGIDYHQFPTLDELDQSDLEKRLRELNFGYRARYIHKAVYFLKYTVDGLFFFEQLKSLSTKDARRQLSQIMGIGRKVADCILLMSFGRHDVVPVDTHMHSIAINDYGRHNDNSNYDEISSFFEQLWQPFAGWAHAAAFTNALRLSPSPRNSTERSPSSLKRSISNNEIVIEKILKISDENDSSQAIKKTIKHGKSIDTVQVVSTRPKRNIKPINRY